MNEPKKRRWPKRLFILLLIAALLGVSVSTCMFASWTEVSKFSQEDALQKIEELKKPFRGAPPYVEIGEAGVRIRHEMKRGFTTKLATLHVANWDSEDGAFTHMSIPMWFVRVKTTDHINLGTLVSVLAKDWKNLDLNVTVEDLEEIGPALILDEKRDGKKRLLVWTEAAH